MSSLTVSRPRRSGRRLRRPVALAVAVVVAAIPAAAAAPAGPPKPPGVRAAEARQQQAEVRRKKAEAAARVDATMATDQELAEALATLNANVAEQQARADDARRATEDARRHATDLRLEIERQQQLVADLEAKIARQAVDTYMNPVDRTNDPSALLKGDDFDRAQQRQALGKVVTERDHDYIDELRGARARLDEARKAAEEATTEAEARQVDEESALAELATARDEQAKVKAMVDRRLAEEQRETAELTAQDGNLTTLIQQAEAEQRAQDEAARKARAEAAARASASRSSAGSGAGVPPPVFSSSSERPSTASGLIWPIAGRVSQEFRPGGHPGMDIFAPMGTPIWAAKGGTVIFAGMNNGGYGNLVIIDHGDGFTTCYAHQSQVLVSVGQQVSQGQVIGLEGSTGYSTGPHLHFETRVNGYVQNPRNYLP